MQMLESKKLMKQIQYNFFLSLKEKKNCLYCNIVADKKNEQKPYADIPGTLLRYFYKVS